MGVLGAGLMGAGIVQVSVDKGYHVILKDTSDAGLMRGMGQVYTGLDTAVKRKRIDAYVAHFVTHILLFYHTLELLDHFTF